ncbi:integrase [Salinibacter ruber]|uniref:tyrosine-type recombinase/integrase n=1 Tax=Salinibacter ruber TaxID=146919 RepID=UPI002168FD5B|nr:tyrosine-type recombinase/integrase [Salinibacter ruber]MCS3669253.1 integrase [Salinibacter ruber]
MPESDRSSPTAGPDHDRQADIRKVAKILRDGNYSYDQSAHLIKKARRRVGLSPPDRSGSGSPERLSSEEQEAFLNAAYDRDGRTGLQMRVLLETGARVSAFVQVRVEDISFRDLEIRLRHTKGDRPRDVPILSSLANAVCKFFAARNRLERGLC